MQIANAERLMSQFDMGTEELRVHSERWKETLYAAVEGREVRHDGFRSDRDEEAIPKGITSRLPLITSSC